MSDANGWRPIETAPKEDDVHFLVWDGFDPVIAYRFFEAFRGPGGDIYKPTHWQPLPGAPEPKALRNPPAGE